jgi:Cu2+-containing amine oxidase
MTQSTTTMSDAPSVVWASLAEMYVPYGSTDLTHTAWNYLMVVHIVWGKCGPT